MEYVDLEELQGAQGLKAIRVEVDTKANVKEFGNEMLKEVVDTINV